jgi:hypothetical protein
LIVNVYLSYQNTKVLHAQWDAQLQLRIEEVEALKKKNAIKEEKNQAEKEDRDRLLRQQDAQRFGGSGEPLINAPAAPSAPSSTIYIPADLLAALNDVPFGSDLPLPLALKVSLDPVLRPHLQLRHGPDGMILGTYLDMGTTSIFGLHTPTPTPTSHLRPGR